MADERAASTPVLVVGACLRNEAVIVRVRCPAKVNLHLEVLGRRADGFHELRTIFAAAGVWDELSFTSAPAGLIELAVEPPGAVPAGEENLVVRAARAFAERLGTVRGTRMTLRKGIPVAGGLGGGSSDAAAALAGLVRLWGGREEIHDLEPLAAELGADVPFFLVGGVAWGGGAGVGGDAAAGPPAVVAGPAARPGADPHR